MVLYYHICLKVLNPLVVHVDVLLQSYIRVLTISIRISIVSVFCEFL